MRHVFTASRGRGLTAPYEGRENLLVVHTCGKALGDVVHSFSPPRHHP
ncbi:hypothetical protein ACVWY5_001357 [Bradyrhizobium sp. USDA 3256]